MARQSRWHASRGRRVSSQHIYQSVAQLLPKFEWIVEKDGEDCSIGRECINLFGIYDCMYDTHSGSLVHDYNCMITRFHGFLDLFTVSS